MPPPLFERDTHYSRPAITRLSITRETFELAIATFRVGDFYEKWQVLYSKAPRTHSILDNLINGLSGEDVYGLTSLPQTSGEPGVPIGISRTGLANGILAGCGWRHEGRFYVGLAARTYEPCRFAPEYERNKNS